jgi:cardiolipin synthase (CMP-forming)
MSEANQLRLDLPTLVTLSRVPLAGLFWLAAHDLVLAFGIIAVAAVTDLLDGWLARRNGTEGGAGTWLDPLCDKIFVVSVLVAVYVWREPPLFIVALVAAREILQAPLLLAWRFVNPIPIDFKASWPGKVTTVLQFIATGLVLIDHPAITPVAIACAISGIASVTYYLRRALGARAAEPPRRSPP